MTNRFESPSARGVASGLGPNGREFMFPLLRPSRMGRLRLSPMGEVRQSRVRARIRRHVPCTAARTKADAMIQRSIAIVPHGAINPVIVAPKLEAALGRTQIAFAAAGTNGVVNDSVTTKGLVVVAFVPN